MYLTDLVGYVGAAIGLQGLLQRCPDHLNPSSRWTKKKAALMFPHLVVLLTINCYLLRGKFPKSVVQRPRISEGAAAPARGFRHDNSVVLANVTTIKAHPDSDVSLIIVHFD